VPEACCGMLLENNKGLQNINARLGNHLVEVKNQTSIVLKQRSKNQVSEL